MRTPRSLVVTYVAIILMGFLVALPNILSPAMLV